ncbi:MAG: hypothetical protein HWD57_13725 [Candidatus Accumulibacter cognatus]|uniref:Membrane-associated oxidoreductase n=1 Tax=Candidatus Accumulibacter cognatus TaxID=2954383 RepID=A0A7D5NE33_9PROT|nr:MAG: hypothetical protein HWD57_13725 [Candidatus Accumulibacter cognatus]
MSDAIEYLRDCVEKGLEADYSDRSDRLIDAPALRDLVLQVKAASIRMRGATIFGALDLRWCGSSQAPLPALCFNECCFIVDGDEPANARRPNVDLSDAHIGSLSLVGSRLTHLRAVAACVHGPVDLQAVQPFGDSDEALCWCKLSRSVIEGDVLADGIHLRAPQRSVPEGFRFSNMSEWDWALNLCASRIGGAVMSRDAPGDRLPSIEGGILLDAASVDGDIYLRAARVAGLARAHAVSLERARIAGSLTIAGLHGTPSMFKCAGAIWMMRCQISGSFDLYGAHLAPESGFALYAAGAAIGSWFTLGQRAVDGDQSGMVRVEGRLWLQDMHVAGKIEITHVRVDRCNQLDTWFKHREPDGLVSLDLSGAHIGSTISLSENEFRGDMDFRDAQCASLRDSPSGYAGAKSILLDGFRYGRVDNTGWESGIDGRFDSWLPGDPGKRVGQSRSAYRPQPFTQLASVLAAHGNEAGAWKVLSRKALFDAKSRWKLQPCSRRLLYSPVYVAARFYGFFFDFGLSPISALATLLLSIILGAGLFGWMDHRNAMVIAQTPVASWVKIGESPRFAAHASDAAVGDIACGLTQKSPAQPSAVAIAVTFGRLLIYAADVFVPLVDLREEGKCDIGAVEAATPRPRDWEVALYQFLKALYATLGWIVTTLALLTFSGVMRSRLAQE